MVRIAHAGIALLAAALFAPPIASGQTPDIRSIALNNVVRIEAPSRSGAIERGYGLIVARESDVLWIATAKHVTEWTPAAADGRDYSPRIAVRMSGRIERFELAGRPRFAADVDLAFLPVRAPLANRIFEPWREAVVAAGTRSEQAVTLLGSAFDSIEIASPSGKIGTDGKKVVGLTGQEAQSGAPVATDNGIIGLYLGSGPNGPADAAIVPISKVAKAAAMLEVPWQLIENIGVSSYVTRVCFKHIGSERPIMIVAGTQTTASPEGLQCAEVHAGRLTLASADPEVACSPANIQLAEQPTNQVTADCGLDIAGIWTNAGLGGAQFTPISSGIWSFEGLETGPYGHITGRVTGKPPRFFFEGQSSQGRPMSGFVSIERRRVSFSFIITSSETPFTGVLRR